MERARNPKIVYAILLAMAVIVVLMPIMASKAMADDGTISYMAWNNTSKKLEETTYTGSYTTVESISSGIVEWSAGWYVVSSDDVNIQDCVYVNGTVNLILCDGAKLEVTGHGTSASGIYIFDNTTLNIYGQSDGTGELVAQGCGGSAGIENDYEGIVTINGGMVTATGGSGRNGGGGAGIGGESLHSAGEITVNGGTVKASGGNMAAGIGGGGASGTSPGGAGGKVTINGGTVTATGGTNGAGIGGGQKCAGGTVTINGGTVTAKGGENSASRGAGIGGGGGADSSNNNNAGGAGGTVTINGGTVTATGGGGGGAGIGGGGASGTSSGGAGGTVTINGGTVTATGSYGAMGIGAGCNSSNNGSLDIGTGMVLQTSTDNQSWVTYKGTRTRYMKAYKSYSDYSDWKNTTAGPQNHVVKDSVVISNEKPAALSLKAVKKGKIKIYWKRFLSKMKKKPFWKKAKFIEIQCSTDPNFEKNVITKIVKKKTIKKKNVKTTLSKLKKKKTYYIRARLFDGKATYSKWSKVVKIKTKR